jgi:DNA end-binding protein Ku
MPARPTSAPLLVSCPVAVWNALHDWTGIRFNMINPETVNRIGMVTTDAETASNCRSRAVR